MTPCPFISSSKRPLSAIFLGSLPPKEDNSILQPPKSPGAVSTSPGFPSPSATDSTGSSSTGDNE
ncbi:hypothetical protein AZE42_10615, partial [Rhizopogon vesiculosus]